MVFIKYPVTQLPSHFIKIKKNCSLIILFCLSTKIVLWQSVCYITSINCLSSTGIFLTCTDRENSVSSKSSSGNHLPAARDLWSYINKNRLFYYQHVWFARSNKLIQLMHHYKLPINITVNWKHNLSTKVIKFSC